MEHVGEGGEMTDREMLELAAKAGGYVIRVSSGGSFSVDIDGFWRGWNPLNSDGDALRLAVTLSFIDDGDWPAVTNEIYTHCNGDWFAATRRAITIAAAKIGKDMK